MQVAPPQPAAHWLSGSTVGGPAPVDEERAGAPRVATRHVPLLLLVYGVFLVVVAITATFQGILVSEHFSTTTLNSIVGNDAATIRTFVNGTFTPGDLTPTGLSRDRINQLESQLGALVERGGFVRIEVRTATGEVILSDRAAIRGSTADATPEFTNAVAGTPSAAIVDTNAQTDATGGPIAAFPLIREFLPLIANGSTQAVFAVWRDARPVLSELDTTRTQVIVVTLSAALICAFLLYLVFRAAQRRIDRQSAQLAGAALIDPLTGLPNHGAIADVVATAIEQARAADAALGVALVDVDNFRLLNESRGYEAGNAVLLQVIASLRGVLPKGATVGRHGPDEFLVIVPAAQIAMLEPCLQRLRVGLADRSLRVGGGDRIPMTISAAIGTYPRDGGSVTELLSRTAMTLRDAKTAGGDTVRATDELDRDRSGTANFDVFRGLVLAIDAKDHYTKRHSEDVARYALFLADRVGLDPELRRALHITGLLHDVGKIGIPDDILRKPASLSDAEERVMQQHVELGDSIVRNLPAIDLVRAGIRHHHERWDGSGYLDHLEAEQIPEIARILAVADAFSAMTTSRPYRKALPIEESLRRLEDAAGTQLEERLVRAFVRGIEEDSAAPLPGTSNVPGLWTPAMTAA